MRNQIQARGCNQRAAYIVISNRDLGYTKLGKVGQGRVSVWEQQGWVGNKKTQSRLDRAKQDMIMLKRLES